MKAKRRNRVGLVWSGALALGFGLGVIGCSDASTPSESTIEDGSLQGELVSYVATFEDGTGETQYFLRTSVDQELRLLLESEPDIAPGTAVKVWGDQKAAYIQVTKIEAVHPAAIESQEQALTNATPKPSHKMAVVLVDTGGGVSPLTVDGLNQSFFTGANSVNAFYQENSYGINGLDGQVLGPFMYPMTTCDTRGMATAMRAMTTETFDQFAYVFKKNSVCAWSGLGSVGEPTKPARDTWYNGGTTTGGLGCVVAVQEPGHNYGMQHSSTMTCGTATFADDPSSCTHNEYGDRFDPMGGGCRHMNVWQKNYEQWFGKCNGVKVTSSGTFNLLPTEIACDGIQALQIPMPKTRVFNRPAGGGGSAGADTLTSYYLEYRTSAGFDTGMTPTVLLHVGGDYRPPTKIGLHTWLLDMHPGTTGNTGGVNDSGFKVGETFTDPAGGVTITVSAMDASKATIIVQITAGTGSPTCLDGTTIAAPGPEVCDGSIIIPDAGVPDPGGRGGAAGTGGSDAGAARPDAGAGGAGGSISGSGGGDVSGSGGGGSSGSAGRGGGADAATAAEEAGAGTSARARAAAANAQDSAGCSCRLAGESRSGGNRGALGAVSGLLIAGVLGGRRRRRHASKTRFSA